MEKFSIQWRHSTSKDLRGLPNQEIARIVEIQRVRHRKDVYR